MASVDEIARGTYRISTWVPGLAAQDMVEPASGPAALTDRGSRYEAPIVANA